jgi:WD40 repeat protein
MGIGLAHAQVHVRDLDAPPGVDPMIVRLGSRPLSVTIHPDNAWLAVQDSRTISLWPIDWRRARVLRHGPKRVGGLAVDPAGRWLASVGPEAPVNMWSVSDRSPTARTTLDYFENAASTAARPTLAKVKVSPRGDLLAAGTFSGLWLLPLTGKPERLAGFNSVVRSPAFDRSGRWLAAGGGILGALSAPGENVVRVWDLETRAVRVLAAPDGMPIASVAFLPDGRLAVASAAGVRVWDLPSGTSTLLLADLLAGALPSPDGRRLLLLRAGMRPGGAVGTAAVYDIESGRTTPLPSHGALVTCIAWDPSGERVVTGSQDGMVRIGAADGSEPHLLFGHDAQVWDVVVDPRGRWVASGGDDGTARLWPMPEGQPFHTLAQAALLDRLRALTTYRVVRDAKSPSGYVVDFEAFTGWQREPPRW